MADAIQAANPAAFIRNDANLIKLGSEIEIPVTAATSAATTTLDNAGAAPVPITPSADVPVPTLPQALDSVPQLPAAETVPPAASPVAEPVETSAPAELTPPAMPARAAPARTVAPADGDSVAAATDEPNPVVAAGAGIVFGLLVSTLLWFRGRLPARKRPAPAGCRHWMTQPRRNRQRSPPCPRPW